MGSTRGGRDRRRRVARGFFEARGVAFAASAPFEPTQGSRTRGPSKAGKGRRRAHGRPPSQHRPMRGRPRDPEQPTRQRKRRLRHPVGEKALSPKAVATPRVRSFVGPGTKEAPNALTHRARQRSNQAHPNGRPALGTSQARPAHSRARRSLLAPTASERPTRTLPSRFEPFSYPVVGIRFIRCAFPPRWRRCVRIERTRDVLRASQRL